jgi:hypothetical protein
MSKNYIRLTLGEQERGLPFKMGTLRQLRGLINGDPFEFLQTCLNGGLEEQVRLVGTIVYACLLAGAAAKKEEPDFNILDVERWVDDLDYSDCELVLLSFTKAYMGEPSGEGGKDTREPATDVAGDNGTGVRGTETEAVGV